MWKKNNNPADAVKTQSLNLFQQVGILLNDYRSSMLEAYKPHSETGLPILWCWQKLQGRSRTQQGYGFVNISMLAQLAVHYKG